MTNEQGTVTEDQGKLWLGLVLCWGCNILHVVAGFFLIFAYAPVGMVLFGGIGLVQLAYVVPFCLRYKAKGKPNVVKGLIIAASVIGTGGFYPNQARTELQLRLIDSETTDIRATLSEDLSDPAAVATFADGVADKIAKTLRSDYPLKGKIASVEGGEIIVGIGGKHGAQTGTRLKVVEEGAPVVVDGEVLGHKQKAVGTLEITKVEDGFAYAKAVEGSGFAKGQHLIEATP